MVDSEQEEKIQVWMKTIDVQMHFNNLEMKVRNFGLTAVGSLVAAAAFAYQDDEKKITTVLLVFSSIVWFAFYCMDRRWYHQLLLAAVESAKKLEDDIPAASLSRDIKEHVCSLEPSWLGNLLSSFRDNAKPGKDPTETQMQFFYLIIGTPPLATAALLVAHTLWSQ